MLQMITCKQCGQSTGSGEIGFTKGDKGKTSVEVIYSSYVRSCASCGDISSQKSSLSFCSAECFDRFFNTDFHTNPSTSVT
jgi:hypothetical protein